MTPGEITYQLAISLMLKGHKLPSFLAQLSIRERVLAVKALDEAGLPMGDGLFEIWITNPGLFAESMDADAITELDRLADLARTVMHQVNLLELAAISASFGNPEKEPETENPKDIVVEPTDTTRVKTVRQVRQAGKEGLNLSGQRSHGCLPAERR